MFPPELNTEIKIRSMSFTIAEHPSVDGIPFGQEGREGTVYKLIGDDGRFSALKVFRPAFRYPSIVKQASELSALSSLGGMRACDRAILNPKEDMNIIAVYPELLYSALMPWIEGKTWTEVLIGKEVLSRTNSLKLTFAFVSQMVEMEQSGIAHTDLSGSNMILAETDDPDWTIEFVDMEGLYAKHLEEPDNLPEGESGYTASFLRDYPDWSALSDRFSGGILIAEMLGWSSEEVREAAWGESYFDPSEIQQECSRYEILTKVLEDQYGPEISMILTRLWNAEELQQCPAFGEWQIALTSIAEQGNDSPKEETNQEDLAFAAEFTEYDQEGHQDPQRWCEQLLNEEQERHLKQARLIEKQGDLRAALWKYGTLVENLPVRSAIRIEIEIVMDEIQQTIDADNDSLDTVEKPVKQILNRVAADSDQSLYQKLWFLVLLGSGAILILAVLFYIISRF